MKGPLLRRLELTRTTFTHTELPPPKPIHPSEAFACLQIHILDSHHTTTDPYPESIDPIQPPNPRTSYRPRAGPLDPTNRRTQKNAEINNASAHTNKQKQASSSHHSYPGSPAMASSYPSNSSSSSGHHSHHHRHRHHHHHRRSSSSSNLRRARSTDDSNAAATTAAAGAGGLLTLEVSFLDNSTRAFSLPRGGTAGDLTKAIVERLGLGEAVSAENLLPFFGLVESYTGTKEPSMEGHGRTGAGSRL